MKASTLSVSYEPVLQIPMLAFAGVASRSLPSYSSKTVPSIIPFGPPTGTRIVVSPHLVSG